MKQVTRFMVIAGLTCLLAAPAVRSATPVTGAVRQPVGSATTAESAKPDAKGYGYCLDGTKMIPGIPCKDGTKAGISGASATTAE